VTEGNAILTTQYQRGVMSNAWSDSLRRSRGRSSGRSWARAKWITACTVLTVTPAIATDLKSGESGIASVYSGHEGNKTASGEKLVFHSMSAAHRTLPFGTMVRVTHRHNNRSVTVRIVDRGPFIKGRVIDITPAAARALGFSGLAPVILSAASKTEHASR
jgi:rare lipoprotein A